MAERVLANPLSGEEIIEAVVDQIRRHLQKDCYLSPNLAYDFFHADVKISLTAHDVGRAAEVVIEETVAEGVRPEDYALEAADAEFHINEAAPNEVRVESGQDVPVLTRDADGKPAIKGIKYSRKALEKASK